MEPVIKRLGFLALGVLLVGGLAGCSGGDAPSGPSSVDVKLKDPYEGMSNEEKIKAIQDDPKINNMQKQSMIDKINGK